MIREVIILAGGLGTRLRSAVPDVPKCMAPVAGKPFIWHVLQYLKAQGVESYIISLGFQSDILKNYIKEEFGSLTCTFVIEDQPLGTGGAVKLACDATLEQDVIVMNGDTLFTVDLKRLSSFHKQHEATCTLSLKPMNKFDRYGVVEINQENAVQSFREKKHYDKGLINGGVYALNVEKFTSLSLPDIFSFEKDFLEIYCHSQKMIGLVQEEYFIDIGIPEDLEKANNELVQRYEDPL